MATLTLLPEFSNHSIQTIVSELSFTKRHILERLVELGHYFGNKKDSCYFSQSYVGDVGGYSRGFTNRVIKELCDLGLVSKVHRGIKRTCLYQVNKIFENDQAQYSLRKLLPVMKKIRSVMKGVFYLLNFAPSYQKSLYAKVAKSPLGNPNSLTHYIFNNYNTGYKGLNRVSSLIENNKKDKNTQPSGGVKRILGCDLTEWGQIKLMAYPRDVVIAVDKSISNGGELRNPMAYFEQACRLQCQKRGIKPDYSLVFRVSSGMGYGVDSPVFAGVPVSRVSEKRIPQVVRRTERVESADEVKHRLALVKERIKKEAEKREVAQVIQHAPVQRQTTGKVQSFTNPLYWASLLGLE